MGLSDQERKRVHELIDAGRGWRGRPEDAPTEPASSRRVPQPWENIPLSNETDASTRDAPKEPASSSPQGGASGSKDWVTFPTSTLGSNPAAPEPKGSSPDDPLASQSIRPERKIIMLSPRGVIFLVAALAIPLVAIASGVLFGSGYLLLFFPVSTLITLLLVLWVLYFVIILAIREANEAKNPLRFRVFVLPVLCGIGYVSLFLGLVAAADSTGVTIRESLKQSANDSPSLAISRTGSRSSTLSGSALEEDWRNSLTAEIEKASIETEKKLHTAFPVPTPRPTPRPTPLPTPFRHYPARLTMQTGVVIEGTVTAETVDSITVQMANGAQRTYSKNIFKTIQRM